MVKILTAQHIGYETQNSHSIYLQVKSSYFVETSSIGIEYYVRQDQPVCSS